MSITQKLVVVGVGSIGRRHGRLLASRGDISVKLCDPRALSEAMEETEAALLWTMFISRIYSIGCWEKVRQEYTYREAWVETWN